MGTPESSEVPAPQLGREAWRYAVPMLSKRLVDFSKGGVDKEKGEVSGIQTGRY